MKNTLSARSARLAVLAVSFLASALPALAQPSLSFTNITKNATNNGLKSNNVFGVYAIGSTIYAATVNDGPDDNGALSISTNGGTSWTNYNSANGLGGNDVNDVYAIGSTIYAATVGYDSNTPGGVSISTNGGGTWTNYTTDNGLGNNITYGVYASGSTVYAATYGGVSISTDGGGNWNNYTTGLLSDRVGGVYASGGTIYAATYSYEPGQTNGGVSISTNSGTSWTNYTTSNGLGSNNVFDVYARGSTVYAATTGGVSISTNGGGNWTNYTTGLGSNIVFGVYASDSAIYAATDGGLSISTDGGLNWTNYTNAEGLGNDSVRGVYASGGNIYAATTGGLSISFSTTPTLYWLGSNGTLWSAGNNWSSNATGTPTANFASGADIIFSATGSTNSTATDLGGDRSIASLTIDSTSPVGISGGNLTVSGATTINNGTLTIGNGGTTGALIGDITNNATLVFNRSNDITYSGSISGVTPEMKPRIEAILAKHGLDKENERSGMRLNALSCVALPTCGLALAESERALPEVLEKFESVLDENGLRQDAISIRITGCPNGCARPYLGEIGFVGKAPNKYALYLGARYEGTRLNRLFSPSITIDGAIEMLRPIFKRYATERNEGERFGDFCDRAILPADASFHSVGTPAAA